MLPFWDNELLAWSVEETVRIVVSGVYGEEDECRCDTDCCRCYRDIRILEGKEYLIAVQSLLSLVLRKPRADSRRDRSLNDEDDDFVFEREMSVLDIGIQFLHLNNQWWFVPSELVAES